MIVLPSLLGAFIPTLLGMCVLLLAGLSRRLGKVTATTAYYRWLYVSVAMLIMATVLRLLSLSQPEQRTVITILDEVFIGLSLLLVIVVAWRYWGWMLTEQDNG